MYAQQFVSRARRYISVTLLITRICVLYVYKLITNYQLLLITYICVLYMYKFV